MPASAGADKQMLLLTTPLGDDQDPVQPSVLHAVAMTASEQIGAPYVIAVSMVSDEATIDPNKLLYQPACVTVHRPPHEDRHFHGIVRQFESQGMPVRGRYAYRMEIVPRLWFMSQTEDCRIFQKLSVADILTQLFQENSVKASFKIFGDKPVREYITQYNETDLQFVHRLMEECGYFYFFEHAKDGHTLVVTDRNQAFQPIADPLHRVVHEGENADVLNAWGRADQTAIGSFLHHDYDPEKPSVQPSGQQQTVLQTAGAPKRDVFRWPALTTESDTARDRAGFHVEAAEAAASLRQGSGFDQEFCPGFRFTLETDPLTGAKDTSFAVQAATHTASDDTWVAGGGGGTYAVRFTCFPNATPWRQPFATERPVMAGIYSAVVLGESGEEIHADALGRVKVRLLFDRRAETKAAQATWVRIMQPWAGNTWGWQHLPRVGTEVGVAFMNGDPDHPVVVGCFYHKEMQPVFPIPDQQTKSGFRSRSSKGGGKDDFSEFSVDDKKGQELVFLHAQKDLTTEVEHDQTLKVDNCRIVTVKQDETVDIGGKQTITVKADRSITVSQGNIAEKVSLGKIAHEAMQSITLTVGQSCVKIDQEGVSISGMNIKINGQLLVDVKGLMVQADGSAMMTLKGGIMMLN